MKKLYSGIGALLFLFLLLLPGRIYAKRILKTTSLRVFIQSKVERLIGSWNLSRKTGDSWDFNRELIQSALHHATKEVTNADEILFDWNIEPNTGIPGGYIEHLDKNIIIGTNGKGEFFLFDTDQKTLKRIRSNLNEIYTSQDYKGKIIPSLFGRFGVRDIFIDTKENEIYASIFVDINGSGCYGMGLYKATIPKDRSLIGKNKLIFDEFFKTKDCNSNFNGHASGGRIKKYKENIIFTVGSLDHNIFGDIKIPQSPNNAIGKVISIDKDGNYQMLSMGHRNQQGLLVVENKIYITEHGPQGGDEINIIKNKLHYGWPYFSYGFDYDDTLKFRMPHARGYEKPFFYFTPSIGISEIVYYKGKEFPLWNNKFIVTSLRSKSLYLLDYDKENERAISYEKIYIGHRIRDIAIMPDGKLLLITDDRKIITLSREMKYPRYTNSNEMLYR